MTAPAPVKPETWSLSGTVTAMSPISHGDGTLGTTTMFRTVRVVQPDGSTRNVPAVSGNAVRGRLRRVSADLAWFHAGTPELTPPQFRVLYQGGALTKKQKRIPSEQVARIRGAHPHLALFGWAGNGRLVEGRSKVSGMVPLCDETAHILPATSPGSFWDRVDVLHFSRMEDTTRATTQTRIGDPSEVADEDTGQMRYSTQVIAPGTKLAWGYAIEDPYPVEVAWARLVLSTWVSRGATVGGRSAAGLGQLDLSAMGEWSVTPEDLDVLASHKQHNKDEMAETVSWLEG